MKYKGPWIRRIASVAALIMVLPTLNRAHKGNAWHGPWRTPEPALAIKGLNSAYLDAGKLGQTASFHIKYPKNRSDKTIFINADRLFVAVVPDAAWSKGYATKADLVTFATTERRGQDLELDFHVSQSGVYHFVFGPWDGDVLVLSSDPNYEPFALTAAGSAKVRWVARIGGDASVAGGAAKTSGSTDRNLLFWVAFLTPDSQRVYARQGLLKRAYPLSESLKSALAQQLLGMGVFGPSTLGQP